MSQNSLKKLIPLYGTVFLDMLGVGIMIPVFAGLFLGGENIFIITSQTQGVLIISLLLSTYPLFQFFGQPILGKLSDSYGRKPLLLASLFGTFLGYILGAVSLAWGSLALLFISRMIDGFTGGNITIAQAMIIDRTNPTNQSKAIGMLGAMFGLGFIIGPYIGGVLSDSSIFGVYAYYLPFLLSSILSLVALISIHVNIKETHHIVNVKKNSIRLLSLLREIIITCTKIYNILVHNKSGYRIYFLLPLLFYIGFNAFTQYFQTYLKIAFLLKQIEIGQVFAFIGILIAITQGLLIGRVSKYKRDYGLLMLTLPVLAIGFVVLAFQSKLYWIFGALTLIAIPAGLTMPQFISIISKKTDKQKQGEILGILGSMQSLSLIVAPLISGLLSSMYAPLPFVFSGVIILVVAIIIFKKRRSLL